MHNRENRRGIDTKRDASFKILIGPFLYEKRQLIPSIVVIQNSRIDEVIRFSSLALPVEEFQQAILKTPGVLESRQHFFDTIAAALHEETGVLDFQEEFISDGVKSQIRATLSNIPTEQALVLTLPDLLLLPGLVDIHTHFRTPGQEWKEDFSSGSRAALKGGITTIFDMPNNLQPIITQQRLDEKKILAGKAMQVNYGFYYGITDDNVDTAHQIVGHCGYKVFLGSSTGNLLITNWKRTLPLCYALEKPVIIHAEDESQIQANTQKIISVSPLDHPHIRNSQVAEAAVLNIEKTLMDFTSTPRAPIIVAHISTRKELDIIRRLQAHHWPVLSEVTPHHLFLDLQDFENAPYLLKANPPLRSQEETLALQQALQRNQITFVSSDHAPHTLEEKHSPQPPSGVPGMEYTLLLLFTAFVEGKLSLQTIINSCTVNPCKHFSLDKTGKIEKGYFADCTLLNPLIQMTIENKDVQSKAGFSPFHRWSVQGCVEATIVNGRIGFWKGDFFPTQPRALFLD